MLAPYQAQQLAGLEQSNRSTMLVILQMGHHSEIFRWSIDHIIISVAISFYQEFPIFSLNLCIHKNWDFDSIPIMHIVGCELEIPLQVPAIGIKRYNALGVEIVAWALISL